MDELIKFVARFSKARLVADVSASLLGYEIDYETVEEVACPDCGGDGKGLIWSCRSCGGVGVVEVEADPVVAPQEDGESSWPWG